MMLLLLNNFSPFFKKPCRKTDSLQVFFDNAFFKTLKKKDRNPGKILISHARSGSCVGFSVLLLQQSP